MIPYIPIREVAQVIPARRFDYAASEYFTEAESLVKTSIRPELASEFRCVLVMAFILAWCNFSLFRKRGGAYMALSALKASRELGIGLNQFRAAITALQGAKLIQVGTVETQVIPRNEFEKLKYDAGLLPPEQGGGKFWAARSIQEKTFIYRLQVIPASDLSEFNPFSAGRNHLGSLNSTELNDWNHLGSHKSTSESLDNYLGSLNSTKEVNPSDSNQAGDISCINVINDHDDDGNARKISEKENSIKAIPGLDELVKRLGQEKKPKYDFLTTEAQFEGFATEDGQTTLDPSEAYKFAIRKKLTLAKIKERHAQVNEMWQAGQVKKSPLALLHYSLKRDKDPRGFGLEALETQLQRQADAEDAKIPSEAEGTHANDVRTGNQDGTNRRGNAGRDDRHAAPVSGRKTTGGYYSGNARFGNKGQGQARSSRYGNPDCTDYNEW
jgi:hypothetical protein